MLHTNKIERVRAYIDGFNLYFGMKKSGDDLLWLNIQQLVLSLLKPHQHLDFVFYFTSRVKNKPGKVLRQKTYLEAVETLTNTEIIYGQYQPQDRECRKCKYTYTDYNEKMTDVNIAVALLEDAFNDKYDTAFLITGDSDLVPPINSVHKLFPAKRVVVAFPPNRFNASVQKAAKGSFTIGVAKIKAAQFPNQVKKLSGYILNRPIEWI